MKKYTVITLKKKNISDFAKERNILLKKAKTDWVLFVDSDEVVGKMLQKEIDGLDFSNFKGFYINRENYFLGEYAGTDRILRFGKKNSGRWERSVHEVWKIKGRVGELNNPIIHNTANSVSEMVSKINSYSTLHARANIKEGKQPGLMKIIFYPKIKLVQSLFMGRGLVLSILQAFHSFLSWSKQWEIQN